MAALYMYQYNENKNIELYNKGKNLIIVNLKLVANRLVVDVPKNLFIKLSCKMSVLINTISSNTEYTLLSIDENNEEKSELIVLNIICVIEVVESDIINYTPYLLYL